MKKIWVNLLVVALLSGVFMDFTTTVVEAVEEENLGNVELENQNSYGDAADSLNDIIETKDGGYLICGEHTINSNEADGVVIRTDSEGNEIWTANYIHKKKGVALPAWAKMHSAIETSDGGYLIVGWLTYGAEDGPEMNREYAWMLKIDGNGEVIWNEIYEEFREFRDVVETEDGGYIAVGATSYVDIFTSSACVFKINASGKRVWRDTYSNYKKSRFYSVKKTKDGNYVLCGQSGPNTDLGEKQRGWIRKIDKNGVKIWDMTVAVNSNGSVFRYEDIIEAENGDYVACGSVNSYNGTITRVSRDGDEHWTKYYAKTDGNKHDNKHFSTIIETEHNTFIVGGNRNIYVWPMLENGYEGTIDEIDNEGNVLWEQAHNLGGNAGLTTIIRVKDGYLASAGEIEYYTHRVGGKIVKFKDKEYKLNYNANGGNGTMTPDSYVFEGEGSLKQNVFTKKGYAFIGWSLDPSATVETYRDGVNYKQLTKKEETLYAIWIPTPIIISGLPLNVFNNDTFQLTTNVEGVWDYDQSFCELVSTKNQATIKALKAGVGTIYFTADNGRTMALEVIIKETYYKIIFDSNGGEGVEMQPISIAYKKEQELSKNTYTRNDYTFEGWAISQEDANQQIITYQEKANYELSKREDQTLYAVWKPIQIEVTDMPLEVQVDEQFEVSLNLAELGSLEYDEAYLQVEVNGSRAMLPIGNKVKFTALKAGTTTVSFLSSNGTKVEKEIEIKETYYNVSFNANGGVGLMESIERTYEEETALPTNVYTRGDYNFEGWATSKEEADAGVVSFLDEELYKLDTKEAKILYAVWKPIQIEVTNMPETLQVDETFEVSLNIEEQGNLEYDEAYLKVAANDSRAMLPIGNKVKFTALKAGITTVSFLSSNGTRIEKEIEIKENYYNISFEANGGEGVMDDAVRTYEEKTALPKNLYTREDYTFEGWAVSQEEANQGTVAYKEGALYKLEAKGAVRLYAVWTVINKDKETEMQASSKQPENVPKTGDTSNVGFLYMLIGGSIVLLRKRMKRN